MKDRDALRSCRASRTKARFAIFKDQAVFGLHPDPRRGHQIAFGVGLGARHALGSDLQGGRDIPGEIHRRKEMFDEGLWAA